MSATNNSKNQNGNTISSPSLIQNICSIQPKNASIEIRTAHANMFQKRRRESDSALTISQMACSHQTKTYTHFSIRFSPVKLKRYHLIYFGSHLLNTATKCEIMIIESDSAKVVLGSEFIGRRYSCNHRWGLAKRSIQSRKRENTLERNMNMNNHQIRKSDLLANFLSQMKSAAIS